MKIAVSSRGENLTDEISEYFGRCPYFIFVQIKNGKIESAEAVKNENSEKSGSAGVATAKLVAEKNANAVVAGNIGPRALDVLKQFGIDCYLGKGKVEEVLQKYAEGKLEKVE